MSDEEDYEAYVQKNREITKKFLTELLAREGLAHPQPLVKQVPKYKEKRKRNRKTVIPAISRRSKRIQNIKKIKRMKGFKGFKETNVVERFNNRITIQLAQQSKAKDVKAENEENKYQSVVINEPLIVYTYDSDNSEESDYDGEIIYYESEDDMNSGEDEEEDDDVSHSCKIKRSAIGMHSGVKNVVVLTPEEITDEIMNNIAQSSTGKIYSQEGTSCHQCRQKTTDTKTICRSGKCVGVRGQFCGPCLIGRYGERAKIALKDRSWSCPPCRDLCNCSICRTRNGQSPTGILAPIAKMYGFNSVREYLEKEESSCDKKKTRKTKENML